MQLFYPTCTLVLASSSPRRQTFLREQGLDFSILIGDGPEPVPEMGEEPRQYTLRTATHKALSVGLDDTRADALVLAADTIVVLDGDILGKPSSPEHAIEMLLRMTGRTHSVITACCFARHGQPVRAFADEARVTFAAWPKELLQAYVNTGEPLDKAGSYGIQGKGAFLVERIEGSWSTVVGLPVSLVMRELLDLGAIRLPQ